MCDNNVVESINNKIFDFNNQFNSDCLFWQANINYYDILDYKIGSGKSLRKKIENAIFNNLEVWIREQRNNDDGFVKLTEKEYYFLEKNKWDKSIFKFSDGIDIEFQWDFGEFEVQEIIDNKTEREHKIAMRKIKLEKILNNLQQEVTNV